MRGSWRRITASPSSLALAIVFVLCACMLCFVGIQGCVSEVMLPKDDVELDAAGLEEDDELPNNTVNTSQLPDNSFIFEVSVEELDSADAYMDDQTVQVTGEVVGDRIIAEEDPSSCWIMLESTANSDAEVSVFLPVASSEVIDTYGAYGKRGTTLQVSGVFYLACRDHHGTSEIHATDVVLVEKGFEEDLPFDPGRLVLGLLLTMAGCAIYLIYHSLSERQR